ncbi:mechanosensitive ion channel family protein, partial [Jatrophihabitans sp. YIM 134969]
PPAIPPSLPPAAPPSTSAGPTTETLPPRPGPTPPDPYGRGVPPGPTSGVVPPPAPPTDELPLARRFARKVRRGDQRDALRDAARTVEAKVPADFRIAIATGVLAIVAAIVQQALFPVSSDSTTTKLIGYGLALVFLVLGIVAVRSLASELSRVSTAKGGRTAAQAIRVTTLLVGYLLVILVTLGIIDVRLGNLLVGGALTGVVIGIAAQQALGNIFAGLVLLFSRPYVPGEAIRVNAGGLGGPHDGVVVSVGLTYTVLLTSYGPLNIPNAQLLAAAIGPQPPEEAAEAEEAAADSDLRAAVKQVLGDALRDDDDTPARPTARPTDQGPARPAGPDPSRPV